MTAAQTTPLPLGARGAGPAPPPRGSECGPRRGGGRAGGPEPPAPSLGRPGARPRFRGGVSPLPDRGLTQSFGKLLAPTLLGEHQGVFPPRLGDDGAVFHLTIPRARAGWAGGPTGAGWAGLGWAGLGGLGGGPLRSCSRDSGSHRRSHPCSGPLPGPGREAACTQSRRPGQRLPGCPRPPIPRRQLRAPQFGSNMENPERKQEEEMGHGAVSRLPTPLRTPDKQPAAAAPTPARLGAPGSASPRPAGASRCEALS